MKPSQSKSINTVRTVMNLRKQVAKWRTQQMQIALVPTMGALHDGHLSLVNLALAKADRVVVSIFINPKQFGAQEDLSTYPRDAQGDRAKLQQAGVDLIFAPDTQEIYPQGFATSVTVDGLTDCMCGLSRPGHFAGVATVVTKLLNQARADVAVFGEKDYQQLMVIKRLACDLDTATEILGAPIIREPDGLALSSRNLYLSPDERVIAGKFNVILKDAADKLKTGSTLGAVLGQTHVALTQAGVTQIDYVDVRDGNTLIPFTHRLPDNANARIFGAIYVGKTRLIDNMAI